MNVAGRRWTIGFAGALAALLFGAAALPQEPNPAEVTRMVDAAIAARYENILSFTDVEHYAVYRGGDETHPAAEMTVRDNYVKGAGKTYNLLSESGSSIFLRFGLKPLLETEQNINQPGNVEKSWFNSSNYEMKLTSAAVQKHAGRDCFALDIVPKEKAPNLIVGTMWVDARDGTLVEIDGVASKDPSAFSGTTHMSASMRTSTAIRWQHMHVLNRTARSSAAPWSPSITAITNSSSDLANRSLSASSTVQVKRFYARCSVSFFSLSVRRHADLWQRKLQLLCGQSETPEIHAIKWDSHKAR